MVDGGRAVIGREHLSSTDADTPPDRLRYDVIAAPEAGRLSMRGETGAPESFSQADVDRGRVAFVHSRGSGPASFVFQVDVLAARPSARRISGSADFYRAIKCIRGTSHGPVSMSVTGRCSIETVERIELVFGM